jgi:hypothetical protein
MQPPLLPGRRLREPTGHLDHRSRLERVRIAAAHEDPPRSGLDLGGPAAGIGAGEADDRASRLDGRARCAPERPSVDRIDSRRPDGDAAGGGAEGDADEPEQRRGAPRRGFESGAERRRQASSREREQDRGGRGGGEQPRRPGDREQRGDREPGGEAGERQMPPALFQALRRW